MTPSTSPLGRLLDGVVSRVLDAPLAAMPPDALSHTDTGTGTTGPANTTGTGTVDGLAALLARRLRADPARPLLTFYDDATGERTELSATTVDNWVAKTANLLVDTLGIGPGDTIRIVLPPHWQTAVILLAAWSSGACVSIGRPEPATDTPPVAIFTAENDLDTPLATGDEADVVALSLRPMGGRLLRPAPGALDFAAEILAHGDRFTPPGPPANQRALVRMASYYARAWGLAERDRVLTTAGYETPEGLLAGLLSPLAAGASLVVCRNLDDALLERRITTERVTAVCGPMPSTPTGIRRLSVPSR
ncbi:TIGR03089 family protein [Frankia sp. CiP3]|uniref:TIGR03089 family protein n=1 Tax=Frankia sp. CiP3 TaxID=2880971 RepID=UPI001EF735B4|nr:TIGR03089 family protein [Frankia sp. CiP3]